jgi:hypothetical protein
MLNFQQALVVALALSILAFFILRKNYLLIPKDAEISKVSWESRAGKNTLRLRGHTYEQYDVKNLLPGGHGNFQA